MIPHTRAHKVHECSKRDYIPLSGNKTMPGHACGAYWSAKRILALELNLTMATMCMK